MRHTVNRAQSIFLDFSGSEQCPFASVSQEVQGVDRLIHFLVPVCPVGWLFGVYCCGFPCCAHPVHRYWKPLLWTVNRRNRSVYLATGGFSGKRTGTAKIFRWRNVVFLRWPEEVWMIFWGTIPIIITITSCNVATVLLNFPWLSLQFRSSSIVMDTTKAGKKYLGIVCTQAASCVLGNYPDRVLCAGARNP